MATRPAPQLLAPEFTTKQLAEHLQLSVDTVNRMILRGDFGGAYQVGRGRTSPWRIPIRSVEDYKARQPQAPGRAA